MDIIKQFCLKARLNWTKAKAKIFFVVCCSFFDIFRLFFDLFCFRFRFGLMWIDLNTKSWQIFISENEPGFRNLPESVEVEFGCKMWNISCLVKVASHKRENRFACITFTNPRAFVWISCACATASFILRLLKLKRKIRNFYCHHPKDGTGNVFILFVSPPGEEGVSQSLVPCPFWGGREGYASLWS